MAAPAAGRGGTLRGPLGALAGLANRLGRSRRGQPAAPAAPDMDRDAADLQRRLELARERLKREIAPPDDEQTG